MSTVVLYRAMLPDLRGLLGLGVICSTLSAVTPALAAGDSTATAVRELASNDDFRVRTQAALALGASGDPKTVDPLCRALDDPKAAVRAAAAAALGKLSRGGAECLEKRSGKEPTDSVKTAIARALKEVKEAGERKAFVEGLIDASTRFYITIGKTADNTQRKKSKVPDIVRGALGKAIARNKGFAVGPETETREQYKKKVSGKKGLKGLLLSPKVQPPEYGDDSVTIRFEIAILTYPDKALKGMIPVKLTQQGSATKSEATEDELIGMAVERAVEKLLKNIERID